MATEDIFIPEAPANDVFSRHAADWAQLFNAEAGFTQTVQEVDPVYANMIKLTETLFALARVNDAGILVCVVIRTVRNLDVRDASRAQHSMDLANGLTIVEHMLEHVTAKNDIEGLVREVQERDVTTNVYAACSTISCDVTAYTRIRAETTLRPPFRRNVKDVSMGRVRAPFLLQAELE